MKIMFQGQNMINLMHSFKSDLLKREEKGNWLVLSLCTAERSMWYTDST